jgi:hypothetical protein
MKKILLIATILMMTVLGIGFARGGTEQNDLYLEHWGIDENDTERTLSGPITFSNRIHAELQSGGTVYRLIYPRAFEYQLDLEEGQRISITGYSLEPDAMPETAIGEDAELFLVSKAVIDGEEYNLSDMGPHYGGMRGGMGMMPGRRGSRGRGFFGQESCDDCDGRPPMHGDWGRRSPDDRMPYRR